MSDRRLAMRINRLEQRANNIRRRLDNLHKWDEGQHRPIRALLRELIAEDEDISDEELVEALAARADDLLGFNGIAETISDIGIRVFAAIAVWTIRNREKFMRARLERIERRVAELRKRLADDKPQGGFGATAEDVLAELGIDAEFVTESEPTAEST